jgi:hypothetical protein
LVAEIDGPAVGLPSDPTFVRSILAGLSWSWCGGRRSNEPDEEDGDNVIGLPGIGMSFCPEFFLLTATTPEPATWPADGLL